MLKKLIPSDDKLLHEKIVKCSYNLDRGKLSYTLTENMFHHNGVGLSANQIGIKERAFVMIPLGELEPTFLHGWEDPNDGEVRRLRDW